MPYNCSNLLSLLCFISVTILGLGTTNKVKITQMATTPCTKIDSVIHYTCVVMLKTGKIIVIMIHLRPIHISFVLLVQKALGHVFDRSLSRAANTQNFIKSRDEFLGFFWKHTRLANAPSN